MGGLGYAEDSAADIACCESAVRGGGDWGRAAEEERGVSSVEFSSWDGIEKGQTYIFVTEIERSCENVIGGTVMGRGPIG